jgi:hypothetical protein
MSNVDVDHRLRARIRRALTPHCSLVELSALELQVQARSDSSTLTIVALHQFLNQRVLSLRLDQTLANQS